MNNTISLNRDKHYGEITIQGDQTDETITKLMEASFSLNNQMNIEYGQVAVLMDVTAMGQLDPAAQPKAVKGFSISNFDKLAIVGSRPDTLELIKGLVSVAGKEMKSKFFTNKAEAEIWLMEKD